MAAAAAAAVHDGRCLADGPSIQSAVHAGRDIGCLARFVASRESAIRSSLPLVDPIRSTALCCRGATVPRTRACQRYGDRSITRSLVPRVRRLLSIPPPSILYHLGNNQCVRRQTYSLVPPSTCSRASSPSGAVRTVNLRPAASRADAHGS